MKKRFGLVVLGFSTLFVIFYTAHAIENEAVVARAMATLEDRPYDPSNNLPYKTATFVEYSGYKGEVPAFFVVKNEEGFGRVRKLLTKSVDISKMVNLDFSKETILFVFAGKDMITANSILMDVIRIKKIKKVAPNDYVEVAVHVQYRQPKASTLDVSPMLVFRVTNKDVSGFGKFKLAITESYSYEEYGAFVGRAVADEVLVKFKSGVTKEQIARINLRFLTIIKNRCSHDEWHLLKITEGTPVEIMVQKYLDLPEVEYAEPNFLRFPLRN